MAKTICITGVTSGIGLETAHRFARDGWNIIGTGRRKDRLDALGKELGGAFLGLNFDVQDRDTVFAAFASLPAPFANIDVLVNNAGLSLGLDSVEKASTQDWDTMIQTNINGLLYCTRAVLPAMLARNSGHILNIGSVAGSRAFKGGNVYASTKAFVNHFSQNLRTDLHGSAIRVTNIEPGMLRTEFMIVRFKGDAENSEGFYEGAEPLAPQDIAEAIWWSVSCPPHMNICSMEIMPVCQADGGWAFWRKK